MPLETLGVVKHIEMGEFMNVKTIDQNKSIVGSEQRATSKPSVQATSFQTCLNETSKKETTVSLNDLFERAAQRYDVPVNLLKAIGYAESAFQVNATSHCGAQGIMQLMPATAKYLGVQDAYDAEQNIMGGAKYISELLTRYDQDIPLALAAYNAGSGNVAKYGGIPPFQETQNYVVKVTNYMKQSLNADQLTVLRTSHKVDVNSFEKTSEVDRDYVPTFDPIDETLLDQASDRWDEIFSYDRYELLLHILNAGEEEEEAKEDELLSQISMNPTVLNLLKGTRVSS